MGDDAELLAAHLVKRDPLRVESSFSQVFPRRVVVLVAVEVRDARFPRHEEVGDDDVELLYVALAAGLYLGAPEYYGQTDEAPQVEVEYDRHRDFSQYHSYAWSESQKPTAKPADHIRIRKAVSQKLEKLGFEPDNATPDLRIAYRLETGKKKVHVDSHQRESIWDPTDLETTLELGGHKETYLVLEMIDTETGALVWWAKCSHVQPTADRVEKSLYDTVERLFGVYPSGDDSREKEKE